MAKLAGPFLRTDDTIERIMRDVLIALVPALIAGIIFFGLRALLVVLIATVSAIVCEGILLRKKLTLKDFFGDGSAAVTGVLLGLILPPGVAWWVPVVGSVLAIALGKLAFGGLGSNIFNPALVGRAILLLGFTASMVVFTQPFDTVTTATPLFTMRNFDWSLVWGNVAGSIGETSVIAILLGAIFLFIRGHIEWRIPVGYIGAAFVSALLWGLDPWFTITAGGLLFAAFFMATDMVTSPVTPMGRLLFGIGCGFLTVFIRQFTVFPEGVTFAILVMNAVVPLLDKLTIPLKFGFGAAREVRFRTTVVAVVIIALTWGASALIGKYTDDGKPVVALGTVLPIAEYLGTVDYVVEQFKDVTYYVAYQDDAIVKAAFTGQSTGFNGPIHFFLVVDGDGVIEHVSVLAHKEDPGLGARITQVGFLEQFIDKDVNSALVISDDIEGLTGATISSRAFASGVRRSLENFYSAFYGSDEEVGGWADGNYTATVQSFGGPLTVEVEVTNGAISSVTVVENSDTPVIAGPAIDTIPKRIVEANSYEVEAISGATVTSEAIMKAVKNALTTQSDDNAEVAEELAEGKKPFDVQVGDGEYEGVADSFGGQMTVKVKVEGGKVVDITVDHTDTPFVADPAIKRLVPALIEEQGYVDAISQATVTSTALFNAVEDALTAKDSGSKPFDVQVGDGEYEGVADSFGGQMTVKVKVEGGKVVDITV
ncbi:MAG: RnfABCDGE type electron transport complex subunit D, partial [Firmicutes bacterium]|nr:RnfABCDGE type electron transport complex subunit D [Bacillota bacterium]